MLTVSYRLFLTMSQNFLHVCELNYMIVLFIYALFSYILSRLVNFVITMSELNIRHLKLFCRLHFLLRVALRLASIILEELDNNETGQSRCIGASSK